MCGGVLPWGVSRDLLNCVYSEHSVYAPLGGVLFFVGNPYMIFHVYVTIPAPCLEHVHKMHQSYE